MCATQLNENLQPGRDRLSVAGSNAKELRESGMGQSIKSEEAGVSQPLNSHAALGLTLIACFVNAQTARHQKAMID